MKKVILLTAVLLLAAAEAWAQCTTQSLFINGRFIMCTTCCTPTTCHTTCF